MNITSYLNIKMRISLVLLILYLALTSCKRGSGDLNSETRGAISSDIEVKYANGFKIQDFGEFMEITVYNPWQNAENVSYRYILSENDTFPSEKNCINIKIPLKKIVCLSTTHLGFISYIGETDAVTGISGIRYVTNAQILENYNKGMVHDVGYDENINYELIIKLQPDLVIAYGVSGTETGYLGKLGELGIQVMYIAEYLEENPLAKMEWVKVFAALFNKTKEVSARYDSAANYYYSLKQQVINLGRKPKVLLGLPWKGTWYVSGGNSYVARLISDAGGDYLWKDLNFYDSRPMGLETIYTRALDADFWLNTGETNTISEVLEVDKRFENLKAIKNRSIYNYNRLTGKQGGNAYFETGVVEPEIILKDLISILHPEVLPSHELKYYKKLE